MKKNLIEDERILNQKRKIGSDACQLLMFFLIGSVLIQQLIFNAPFASYAVEFFGFFGASIYIVIRSIFCGHDLFSKNSKKRAILLNSFISGISIAGVTLFLNFSSLSSPNFNLGMLTITLLTSFVIGSLFAFITYACLGWINQKRMTQLEKNFDDDDY